VSITIIIIDDDLFICTSLATILNAQDDMQVIATGVDGAAATELFAEHQPDILLMDIQMPKRDGLAAASEILAQFPEARIIFLTTFASDEYIVQALHMGAKGYLIKQDVAAIAPALRLVMKGQSVLGGEVLQRIDTLVGTAGETQRGDGGKAESDRLQELSERERKIVELVAQGMDNREIAAALYISEGPARNQISAILTKLALKNRTQLAVYYWRTYARMP
jgi:DNA-binding NarL/FixJ family response regulator